MLFRSTGATLKGRDPIMCFINVMEGLVELLKWNPPGPGRKWEWRSAMWGSGDYPVNHSTNDGRQYLNIHQIALCYAMLCYAILRYAMLSNAMLRYAILCYANIIFHDRYSS